MRCAPRRQFPALLVGLLPFTTLPSQAPTAAEPSREARVLALLRTLPEAGNDCPIVVTTNQYGCTVIAPRVRGCGNGWKQPFDPDRARAMARELCAIYGLGVAADAPAPGGVPAILDAFDAAKGIGLELRGSVEQQVLGDPAAPRPLVSTAPATWPTVVDEAAASDLDIPEHQALAAKGLRIAVADVADYFQASSGDHFATTLAYLATVAHFLNEVTDGDDVDFDALLGASSMLVDLELPKPRPGREVVPFGGGFTLTLARQGEVILAIDPARAMVPTGPLAKDRSSRAYAERAPAKTPLANAGRPTRVQLWGPGVERGSAQVILRQRLADGSSRDLATSASGTLLVPGTFDSTRRFELVLRLDAGSYRFGTAVWIGAPEP